MTYAAKSTIVAVILTTALLMGCETSDEITAGDDGGSADATLRFHGSLDGSTSGDSGVRRPGVRRHSDVNSPPDTKSASHDVGEVSESGAMHLCRPCQTRHDCRTGDVQDECLDYGWDGAFCGAPCSDPVDCPDGFLCMEATAVEGGASKQCVRASGLCACSEEAIEGAWTTRCLRSNDAGACEGTRVCTESGLSECDALEPALDICNGLDDDCDGAVDPLSCDDGNPCTADDCGDFAGCVHEATPGVLCDDKNAGTKEDQCDGQGQCSGVSFSCAPGQCEESSTPNGTDCAINYKSSGASCDDKNAGTKNDQCDGSGGCSGTSYSCTTSQCEESSTPDGTDCTTAYKSAGSTCDDSNADTSNDQCDGQGQCVGAANPGALVPCDAGTCWNTTIAPEPCTAKAINENFATGNYNVHAYHTSVSAGVDITFKLKATGGAWAPGIIVTRTDDGTVLSDGVTGISNGGVVATVYQTGGGDSCPPVCNGNEALVKVSSTTSLDLVVYVTGWEVISGGFEPFLTTSATYTLTATQTCSQGDVQNLVPCANGSCWNTSISVASCCGPKPQDFTSGNYNVHAYSATIQAGKTTSINLSVTGGSWKPAIIVRSAAGAMFSDGKVGLMGAAEGLQVVVTTNGTSGNIASVDITSSTNLSLVIYVTGWHVVDGDFTPAMPTNAYYSLNAAADCSIFEGEPPAFCAWPIVNGIDVSFWQGSIDWQLVADAGIDFAFVRASYSNHIEDSRFDTNWSSAKNVGIVRAPYHFLTLKYGANQADFAEEQAEHFINIVGSLEPGDLPPMLDLEHDSNNDAMWEKYTPKDWKDAITRWLEVVENEWGVKPIVYANPSFWTFLIGNNATDPLSEYLLWVANYTISSCPTIKTKIWDDWTFWQYTQFGEVPGICGNTVDLNVFNGDMVDLNMLTYSP